jgi:hypothetical protein
VASALILAAATAAGLLAPELTESLELRGAEVGGVFRRRNHLRLVGDVGVEAEQEPGFDFAVETGLGAHATRRREHDHEKARRGNAGDHACKKLRHRAQSYPRPRPSLA